MSFEIIKAILLILLGGFITFLFNLLIGKLQRQQPRLVWRSFPSIHIATEGLSGNSWLIENTGRKSAKNVRLTFSLPPNAKFNSFEIIPSETALSYSISDDSENPRSKTIAIPLFIQGVSISVSSLIAGLGDNNVTVSLVGEDIIGTEKNNISEEVFERKLRFAKRLLIAFYGLIIIGAMTFFSFILYVGIEGLKFNHTYMIANLYLQTKSYDTAIDLYNTYNSNQIMNIDSGLANHQLARIYALKGDKIKSIIFLEKLNRKHILKNLAQDSAFDNIRSSSEFQEYIKKCELTCR